ncbi:MAG: N-acetylmuramoyl-L-alanine amidase [candidate division FCPU426 bacterium]
MPAVSRPAAVLLAAGLLALWPALQALAVDTAVLRLEASGRPGVALPLQSEGERVYVPLRQAVEYLGGKTSWQASSQRVLVQGTNGRTASLNLGLPKSVVDRTSLLRLPASPRLVRGQVVVTPETLVTIWRQVGQQAPAYDSQRRLLTIGAGAAEPAEEPKAAPSRGKPLVVLDPGHGGKDPGAIGPSGLKEKVVTLEVGLKLRDLLAARGFRVLMTRSDDTFISLQRRAEIANEAKADLFVSIHANASRNAEASGSQVFIYNREASSRQAAEAARLENQDANYLEIIKDDLRQAIHEEASITAGGLVSQHFETVGLNAKRIERAPFYVLAKSHMPSILVETAFISNNTEESKLRSRAFCKRLAEVIDRGLTGYYRERLSEKAN